MVKVVVLDVDGTLMDTNYQHTEAWARALADVGRPVPRAEVHRGIGKGSEILISDFVDDEDAAERVDELHADIYMDLQQYAQVLPGAKELIASLSGNGFQVWLVTSAKPEELEKHLEKLEAEEKLAGIVNSSDVEQAKPAPDVFELALERAGIQANEAIAVGDSVWDVEAAKVAGVRTVAVLTGGAFGAEELKEAGAIEVYEDCAALVDSGFPDWAR
ncbi:MAG: HAD family hydrolase [Rubrobacter sp.]|nr:HAD family hydrolase [Rubrobacter sp.]